MQYFLVAKFAMPFSLYKQLGRIQNHPGLEFGAFAVLLFLDSRYSRRFKMLLHGVITACE